MGPPTSGEVMDDGMGMAMEDSGMHVLDPMTNGMTNGDYMTESTAFGGPVAVDMES